MAHEEDGFSPDEVADRAWHLAEKIRIALFNTWDGEQQRIRPLSAHVDRERHEICFLVGAQGGTTLAQAVGAPALTLVEQIERYPTVGLAFAEMALAVMSACSPLQSNHRCSPVISRRAGQGGALSP